MSLLCALGLAACVRGEPRLLSESPDHRHRVEVQSRRPIWDALIPRGPGQGSDVPGLVRLCDRQGRVLHAAPVELLSALAPSDVHWSADRVEITLIADWPLEPER